MKYCIKCKTEWKGLTQPGARESCVKCDADLHVCVNCRFYDVHKPNNCQIDTDPVLDKEKANFCEEFQFIDRPLSHNTIDEKQKAKEKWKKLFKE